MKRWNIYLWWRDGHKQAYIESGVERLTVHTAEKLNEVEGKYDLDQMHDI